jgi:uncharacterized protein involved in exopolysaccharide biosynthesis
MVLAKHKKLILGLPLLAGFAALLIALVMPKIYTATARIIPPHQKEASGAAVLASLAGVAGGAAAPIGQALGLRNPNELYVGILKSRTIADRLIERFNLRNVYKAANMTSTRIALEGVTRVSAGKDGLITIEVDDKDAKRAASLANAYVEELDRLMQSLALTEASQRRLFLEKQLTNAREQLITSEVSLRRAIDSKGIVGVDAQSRALVGTAEQLRAQIAVKEIQLDAMRSFATQSNPDAVRLRQEIASMKGELAHLEGGRTAANHRQSPTGLENIRKLREVKFLEFTVELLTKQYEIARIDEARDAVLIQIVDHAVAPDYKSRPKRGLIVIVTVLVAGLVAVIGAFVTESLQRARLHPQSSSLSERLP